MNLLVIDVQGGGHHGSHDGALLHGCPAGIAEEPVHHRRNVLIVRKIFQKRGNARKNEPSATPVKTSVADVCRLIRAMITFLAYNFVYNFDPLFFVNRPVCRRIFLSYSPADVCLPVRWRIFWPAFLPADPAEGLIFVVFYCMIVSMARSHIRRCRSAGCVKADSPNKLCML